MNWLDIVLIVVIAVTAFMGLRMGLIKAVLSLVGMIVGVILAGLYYVPLSEQLSFIPHEGAAKIIAFVIILVVVMVITSILATLLKWAASLVMLGWLNRIGGAVFGLVLGAIFCGALLATFAKFLNIETVISESVLATVFLHYFPIVLALLPGEFDAVRSFFQ
jgi:membrane protein required for colicin V production